MYKRQALLLGGTQLTDPVAVAGNGSFTISYKTSEKGIQTTGQAQILTVKYGGSDDLNEGSAACSITLNPKKVQAEVDGAITKPFDQTAKAHVTLKLAEGALVNSSDDVTVSAPDAAYEKTDVGNDIAINLGTLQVDGNDKSFYQVIAPRSCLLYTSSLETAKGFGIVVGVRSCAPDGMAGVLRWNKLTAYRGRSVWFCVAK